MADFDSLRVLLAAVDQPMLNLAPLPWAICDEPKNPQWYKGITIYANRDGPGPGIRVADLAPLRDDADNVALGGLIVETINSLPALLDELSTKDALLKEALEALEPFANYPRRYTDDHAFAQTTITGGNGGTFSLFQRDLRLAASVAAKIRDGK